MGLGKFDKKRRLFTCESDQALSLSRWKIWEGLAYGIVLLTRNLLVWFIYHAPLWTWAKSEWWYFPPVQHHSLPWIYCLHLKIVHLKMYLPCKHWIWQQLFFITHLVNQPKQWPSQSTPHSDQPYGDTSPWPTDDHVWRTGVYLNHYHHWVAIRMVFLLALWSASAAKRVGSPTQPGMNKWEHYRVDCHHWLGVTAMARTSTHKWKQTRGQMNSDRCEALSQMASPYFSAASSFFASDC